MAKAYLCDFIFLPMEIVIILQVLEGRPRTCAGHVQHWRKSAVQFAGAQSWSFGRLGPFDAPHHRDRRLQRESRIHHRSRLQERRETRLLPMSVSVLQFQPCLVSLFAELTPVSWSTDAADPYIDGVRINSPHYLCKILQTSPGLHNYTLVVSQFEKVRVSFFPPDGSFEINAPFVIRNRSTPSSTRWGSTARVRSSWRKLPNLIATRKRWLVFYLAPTNLLEPNRYWHVGRWRIGGR